MKIAVAGGAGYIGSILVPVLIEHSYEVDVIDFLWFGNHLPGNINIIKKDLFNCTEEDLKKYDKERKFIREKIENIISQIDELGI